jgi:hypothetical protein
VQFLFTAPFAYDGTNNLMIDFSFNNSDWESDGECVSSGTTRYRALVFQTDSAHGDPLGWSGLGPPAPKRFALLPNIRFFSTPPLTQYRVLPSMAVCFSNGVWQGPVTVLHTADRAVLQADDADGHTGDSNPFDVGGDTDGDGMPDWWEDLFDLYADDPDDALLDSDGDGLSNLREYLCGTHPGDRTSCLRVQEFDINGPGIGFHGEPGRRYAVEWTDDLLAGSWRTVRDDIVGTGDPVWIADPEAMGSPHRLYRIRLP